jgi:hypothetical protein
MPTKRARKLDKSAKSAEVAVSRKKELDRNPPNKPRKVLSKEKHAKALNAACEKARKANAKKSR